MDNISSNLTFPVPITCIVGDETGLLKSVYFPNVFANKSEILKDRNNKGNSSRKIKSLNGSSSKRRKINHSGGGSNSGFTNDQNAAVSSTCRIIKTILIDVMLSKGYF